MENVQGHCVYLQVIVGQVLLIQLNASMQNKPLLLLRNNMVMYDGASSGFST